jgi:hypothetical protein
MGAAAIEDVLFPGIDVPRRHRHPQPTNSTSSRPASGSSKALAGRGRA